MNRLLFATVATAAVCALQAADAPQFKDSKDKASYAVGARYGKTWQTQGFEIDPERFAQGMKDAYAGKSLLTDEELAAAMADYQKEVRGKADEKRQVEAAANKEIADKFLAENKGKADVKTLDSGLQYKVITEGSGESPKDGDTVTTHYVGTFLDGKEFDSSIKRGQPATFNVNAVIRGWTEALKMMKKGSKWQLFVPPDLGYGERGFGQNIPPNSALIFEVELIDFKETPKPVAAEPVTSDIIKVPSAEELKKGAKIEIIKPDQVKKEQEAARQKQNAESK